MKLKFLKGRDDRPISRLSSGKIVFPERGAHLELGKYYIGEIVFEKSNFAVFRPIRQTEYIKYYKCGHREIERGGLFDEMAEIDCLCHDCSRKEAAKQEQEYENRIKQELEIITPESIFSGKIELYAQKKDLFWVYKAILPDGEVIDVLPETIDRFREKAREFLAKHHYNLADMEHQLKEWLRSVKKSWDRVLFYRCPVCGANLERTEYVRHYTVSVDSVPGSLGRGCADEVEGIFRCPNGHGFFDKRRGWSEDTVISASRSEIKFDFATLVVEDEIILEKTTTPLGCENEVLEVVPLKSGVKLKEVGFRSKPANQIRKKRRAIKLIIDSPVADLIYLDSSYLPKGCQIERRGSDKRFTRLFRIQKKEV